MVFLKKNYLTTKKEFFKILTITFILVFITDSIVIYLWNFIIHAKGAFNWGISIGLSITISVAISLATTKKEEKKK